MRRPGLFDVLAMVVLAAMSMTCSVPELCTPQEGTVGFFSQGDCALTKQSAFRGHEWITLLGNRDLGDRRFSDREMRDVIEGNRRVDWPKELLVHMAHSVVAYASAATAHHDRPENQPLHFLLGRDNESADAVLRAQDVVRARTRAAVAEWSKDRRVALTRAGEACHLIQDSFSFAHAVRAPESTTHAWCVKSVKAYVERAPGFELPGDRFHGGRSGDSIGHTTTLDSIYKPGRDCNDPLTVDAVESCLSDEARRARLSTRDYLELLEDVAGDPATDDAAIDAKLDVFFAAHLALCP